MAGHQGTSTRRSTDEFLAALNETERADINTTAVGTVVSYDAKTQTAVIQPKLSMMIAGEKVRAPELTSVPVQQSRAGDIIIHQPMKKGDEVMLHFAQRPLDEAIEDDGDQAGNRSGRMHSLSDALAVPMAHSKGKQLPNLPADRLHFGSEDGKSGLQMKGDGSFDLVRNGDTVFKILEDFLTAFRDHIHDGGAPHDKVSAASDLIARVGKMKAT